MNALLNMVAEKEELLGDSTLRRVREIIAQAADVIAPVWPIKHFVACNPLQGLEDLPFEQAVSRAIAYLGTGETANNAVNRELIKWCIAFLDEGQATIAMPNRSTGFYATFTDLAPLQNASTV